MKEYTQEEILKRCENYCCEANDGLDMALLFNMHNMCDDEKVNIYDKFIEVYECDLWVEGNDDEDGYYVPSPYFEDNFFRVYPPTLDDDGSSYLKIEFVDYNEDIDIEERNEVMAELKTKLPYVIEVDYIKFDSDFQGINWFFDFDDDEIFEI